jgi:hypothetical protein
MIVLLLRRGQTGQRKRKHRGNGEPMEHGVPFRSIREDSR